MLFRGGRLLNRCMPRYLHAEKPNKQLNILLQRNRITNYITFKHQPTYLPLWEI
jgi:hypothetical protein